MLPHQEKYVNFIKVHFPGAMIGQEPWPLKLRMNFTWILPPSTSHGQVNSGEKKTLPLDWLVKRNSKPRAPPRTYLSLQSFYRSIPLPLPNPRCAILFPRPWVQVTTSDERTPSLIPPTPSRRTKASLNAATKGANKRISKLPSGKEVLPSGQSNPRFRSPALYPDVDSIKERMVNSNCRSTLTRGQISIWPGFVIVYTNARLAIRGGGGKKE